MKVALAALVAATLAVGYGTYALAERDGADPAAAAVAASPAPFAEGSAHVVEWKGYARAGPADSFAHTKETEPIVAPLARMGFEADVPEWTSALRFRLTWPAGPEMHLMVHGPHEEGMPTYMGEWPDGGEACLQVPADGVLPGVWKVMAHVERTAVDVAFTIAVETTGPAPVEILDDGPHGHAMDEKMKMEHREAEPCATAT